MLLICTLLFEPTVVDVDDVGDRLLALCDVSTDGELLQYFIVDAVPLLICVVVIDSALIDELSWVIEFLIGDVAMIELCNFGTPPLDGLMMEL